MKPSVKLETQRLIIRHLTLDQQDREFFHFILSDETVRHFYVTRKTRKQSDEILERVVSENDESNLKWGVACLKSSGRPIGFTGLADVPYETPITPCVEIGWLFRPDCWGKGYATEAALALLEHGFEDIDLKEIVAFAVHNNRPSIAVMQRIGMNRVEDGDFDHPMVPDTHAHLQHHVLYHLTASQWHDQQQSS